MCTHIIQLSQSTLHRLVSIPRKLAEAVMCDPHAYILKPLVCLWDFSFANDLTYCQILRCRKILQIPLLSRNVRVSTFSVSLKKLGQSKRRPIFSVVGWPCKCLQGKLFASCYSRSCSMLHKSNTVPSHIWWGPCTMLCTSWRNERKTRKYHESYLLWRYNSLL